MKLAAIAILTYSTLGCGKEFPQDGPPPKQAQLNLASPHETFVAYQEAIAAEKWERVFLCLTPESRNAMLFGMVAWGPGDDEPEKVRSFGELFTEADLDRRTFLRRFFDRREKTEDEAAAMNHMMAAVSRQPAFFASLMEWYIANEPSSEFARFRKLRPGTLKNVELHTDTATGWYAPSPSPRAAKHEHLVPIVFEKVEERWLIDLSKSKK